MKAAAGIDNIEEGIRFQEVEEKVASDPDAPLSQIMEVPAVLDQDPPAEVVMRGGDEAYPAVDEDAPPAEVNRIPSLFCLFLPELILVCVC